jgi:hypothetical protein
LNRSVVLSVDSLGTGAILTVNLTDDFLVLSAHVNSRFINTAICVPPIGFTPVVEQVRPGRRVYSTQQAMRWQRSDKEAAD